VNDNSKRFRFIELEVFDPPPPPPVPKKAMRIPVYGEWNYRGGTVRTNRYVNDYVDGTYTGTTRGGQAFSFGFGFSADASLREITDLIDREIEEVERKFGSSLYGTGSWINVSTTKTALPDVSFKRLDEMTNVAGANWLGLYGTPRSQESLDEDMRMYGESLEKQGRKPKGQTAKEIEAIRKSREEKAEKLDRELRKGTELKQEMSLADWARKSDPSGAMRDVARIVFEGESDYVREMTKALKRIKA